MRSSLKSPSKSSLKSSSSIANGAPCTTGFPSPIMWPASSLCKEITSSLSCSSSLVNSSFSLINLLRSSSPSSWSRSWASSSCVWREATSSFKSSFSALNAEMVFSLSETSFLKSSARTWDSFSCLVHCLESISVLFLLSTNCRYRSSFSLQTSFRFISSWEIFLLWTSSPLVPSRIKLSRLSFSASNLLSNSATRPRTTDSSFSSSMFLARLLSQLSSESLTCAW